MQGSRGSGWWRSLGAGARGRVASAAAVAGIVALELALSAAGFGRGALMEGSARTSLRLLPDQEVLLPRSEVPMRINAQGFRGPDWDPPPTDAAGEPMRDPRLLRVAVLGHSVTLGGWEPIEETFCGVLERRLQEELDRAGDPRRALVMNFAGPAYGLADMRAVFEDHAHRFRPDYLVVPFFAVDVRPPVPVLEPRRFPLRGWVQRTATFDWLTGATRGPSRILTRAATPDEARAFADAEALSLRARDRPFDPALAPLWERALEDLEALRALQASTGGRTVLAAPVELRDLRPTAGWEPVARRLAPWCAVRDAVILVDLVEGFRDAIAPLRRELGEKGIALDRMWSTERPTPPAPELEHAGLNPFLRHSPGHYTPFGHRLVGEALAEAILRDLERG